jgi:hypothetical protein
MPTFSGQSVSAASVRSIAKGGSSKPAVIEDDHRHVLGGRVYPERDRGRRRRADDVGFADETEEVRRVTAAGALDVIGVDRSTGDRGDRVLELGGLVQAVGVECDRNS